MARRKWDIPNWFLLLIVVVLDLALFAAGLVCVL